MRIISQDVAEKIAELNQTLSKKSDAVIEILTAISDTIHCWDTDAIHTDAIQIEDPPGEAFACLRVLNQLEDLTLDKTGDRHEPQFKQYGEALHRECQSCLSSSDLEELQEELQEVAEPFSSSGLSDEKAIAERAQRFSLIQQLRIEIVHRCNTATHQDAKRPDSIHPDSTHPEKGKHTSDSEQVSASPKAKAARK